MVIVTATHGNFRSLFPVTAPGCHPLPPFVVGHHGDCKQYKDENAEDEFHLFFRIARIGQPGGVLPGFAFCALAVQLINYLFNCFAKSGL